MEKGKFKLSTPMALIILSVCILAAANTIAQAIREIPIYELNQNSYMYELEQINETLETINKTIKESGR